MKQLFGALSGALFALASMSASAAVELGDNEYIQFYHRDVLGSPLAVSDEKGRILWHENTAPYGKSLGRVAADGTRFDLFPNQTSRDGYTGHVKDVTSGLTYMRARYYDPVLGQLSSNDPLGYRNFDPASFNRYAYANHNPYAYVDPTGRSSEEVSNEWTEISVTELNKAPTVGKETAVQHEISHAQITGGNTGSSNNAVNSHDSNTPGSFSIEVAGALPPGMDPRSSPAAAIRNAIRTGNVEELKMLIEYGGIKFSKEIAEELVAEAVASKLGGADHTTGTTASRGEAKTADSMNPKKGKVGTIFDLLHIVVKSIM